MNRKLNKLTNKIIQSAVFVDKPKKIFDGGGLYLHVQKSGKYWRMKYRFSGKEQTLALGVYPDVSLKEARELRAKNKKIIKNGINPNALKKDKGGIMKQEKIRPMVDVCRVDKKITHLDIRNIQDLSQAIERLSYDGMVEIAVFKKGFATVYGSEISHCGVTESGNLFIAIHEHEED